MVGGGPGAFIGEVHRMAAALDGELELVAGAFSSDRDRSRAQGVELGLHPGRVYGSYGEMAEVEAGLPRAERIQLVSVVTPNHLHFDPARRFLEAGIHVVCDKPLTTTVEDAEALRDLVRKQDLTFAVTYNYTGYPMVKEAREWIRSGRLGEIRKVVVEYLQGWLATPLEDTGHRQATWRTDPARAGIAGALGDIGTHAHDLVRYVTGLELERLCADLTTFVAGRRLDDDASLLMRFAGGARGSMTVSQVAVGEDNGLSLRVFGTEGALTWRQEAPDELALGRTDGVREVHRRGHDALSKRAKTATRLPAGHPEGFIEAFATIYRNVARTLAARSDGREPAPADLDFPTVDDGLRGVHFIDRAVISSKSKSWVDAAYVARAGARA
jgi:predicted dehydrogenase